MYKYGAKIQWGKPLLVKIGVVRETEKRFYITDVVSIIGYNFLRTFVLKTPASSEDYTWFDNPQDAVNHLILLLNATVKREESKLQDLIEKTTTEVTKLKELLDILNTQES